MVYTKIPGIPYIVLVGTFSCAQFDSRKARERESAILDEKPAVGLLNPMRDKNRRQARGGGRDDTCDHGLSRKRKVDVCDYV